MNPKKAARFLTKHFKSKKKVKDVETALDRRLGVEVKPKVLPVDPEKKKAFTIVSTDRLDTALHKTLEKRFVTLAGATYADTDLSTVKEALKDAKAHLSKTPLTNGDLTHAKGALDTVAAKSSAPGFDLSTLEKIRGVSFDDQDALKSLAQRLTEENQAQSEILDELKEAAKMRKSKDTPQWPIFPSLMAFVSQKEKFNAAIQTVGPDQEKKAKAEHAAFKTLYNDFDKSKDALREIYVQQQREKLLKEMKHGDPDSSKTMGRIQGMEFFENLQTAEVKCKIKGFDPYSKSTKAFENGTGPREPMEMGEVAALFGYSTEDYTKVNGRLRSTGDVKDSDGLTGDPLDAYVTICRKALAKLPVYKKEVWRADPNAQYFLDDLDSSQIRTEKAFFSTATSSNLTAFGGLLTKITGIKTGREISAFSLYTGEGEVLFPDGAKFRFVAFDDGKGNVCKTHAEFRAFVAVLKDKGLSGKDLSAGTFELVQV